METKIEKSNVGFTAVFTIEIEKFPAFEASAEF